MVAYRPFDSACHAILMVILVSSCLLQESFQADAFSPAFVSTTHHKRSAFTRDTSLCMASSGPMSCRPVGIGSAVPTTRITNFDLEQVVETSDEWIQTRTGIGARRVLVDASHAEGDSTSPPETLRDLSVRAGRAALEMAGLEATDIDMVICCTSTPDDMFGDAPSVAAMLGCSTGTVAFDLTAACSGFLFGIVTAGQFLSASSSKTALVVGADALSRWVDWEDRNSCILFGDGAGAMILQSTQSSDSSPGVLGYAAHSNGLGYCDLQLGYVTLAHLFDTVHSSSHSLAFALQIQR
jgi:3-oxoacyl-[acyl-carrier-protein] synthase III